MLSLRKVYVAAKFEAKERLQPVRHRLEAGGIQVVGTWLDEETSTPTHTQKVQYAKRDMAEVMLANLLILDTLDDNNRGGREVEYGMALATGKNIIIVGPFRNVFHTVADARFDTWKECYEFLGI